MLRVTRAQLHARARADVPARIHLLEILPYVALLYIGIHYLGLIGAAVAWTLRCLADLILLSRKSNVREVITRQLATNGVLVVVVAIVMSLTMPLSLTIFAAIALLAASVVMSWRTVPLNLRDEAIGSLGRMLRLEKGQG